MFCDSQIVIITNFVVVSRVGIKRVDCIIIFLALKFIIRSGHHLILKADTLSGKETLLKIILSHF